MIYTVVINVEAENEIINVFLFIQEDSVTNAEHWLHGLYEAIATLESFPRRFPLAREAGDFPGEVRQMIYKSHRVLFEIEGSEVHVTHVRHAAQDNLPPPGENYGNKENN